MLRVDNSLKRFPDENTDTPQLLKMPQQSYFNNECKYIYKLII